MSGRAERAMAELDSPLAFTSAKMLETEFDELRLFPSVSGHDATLLELPVSMGS